MTSSNFSPIQMPFPFCQLDCKTKMFLRSSFFPNASCFSVELTCGTTPWSQPEIVYCYVTLETASPYPFKNNLKTL